MVTRNKPRKSAAMVANSSMICPVAQLRPVDFLSTGQTPAQLNSPSTFSTGQAQNGQGQFAQLKALQVAFNVSEGLTPVWSGRFRYAHLFRVSVCKEATPSARSIRYGAITRATRPSDPRQAGPTGVDRAAKAPARSPATRTKIAPPGETDRNLFPGPGAEGVKRQHCLPIAPLARLAADLARWMQRRRRARIESGRLWALISLQELPQFIVELLRNHPANIRANLLIGQANCCCCVAIYSVNSVTRTGQGRAGSIATLVDFLDPPPTPSRRSNSATGPGLCRSSSKGSKRGWKKTTLKPISGDCPRVLVEEPRPYGQRPLHSGQASPATRPRT